MTIPESTEKQRHQPQSGKIRLVRVLRVLALVAGIALEIYLAWYLWFTEAVWSGGQLAAPFSLLLALIAGAGLTALGLSFFSPGNQKLAFWLFLGLTLFMPLYGALGSLFIVLYQRRSSGTELAAHYTEYIHAEESEETDEEEHRIRGSVDQMVHQELAVQSYMDIIRGPDRVLKKALIGKILSEWTPNAVSLLKVALNDPEYEIRSYGSTALTMIENRTNKGILQLQEDIAREPDDIALKLKLARSYLDYASSGLLDPSSAEHYVHLASDALAEIQEEARSDDEFGLELLTLRAQAARLAGDQVVEKQAYEEILQHQSDNQEILRHLCALHFREKDFGRLRRACARFLQHTDITTDHPALAAARLWSGESDTGQAGAEA